MPPTDRRALQDWARRILPPPPPEAVEGALDLFEARDPAELTPEELRRRAEARLVEGLPLEAVDVEIVEAIILPERRPVYLIAAGDYPSTRPHWPALDTAEVRARLKRAIAAVARIELPGDQVPFRGSGVLVGDRLLMTNRHVARHFTTGVGTKVRMTGLAQANFLAEAGRPASPDATAKIVDVVLIHDFWDVALLRLDRAPAGAVPLALENAVDPAGRTIAVVGYPAEDPRNPASARARVFDDVYDVKRLQPGEVGARRRRVKSFGHEVPALTHDASTLGGNSGSAVIDVETGNVLALHFAGIYLEDNFAVPASALASDERVRAAGVELSDPTAPIAADERAAAAGPAAVATPQGVAMATVSLAHGQTDITLPIEIVITVGEPRTTARSPTDG